MKYVEGIDGHRALQIPSNEYSLAGRALDLELAYQPWDGPYMPESADDHFVELTIEGLGVQRNQEPSQHDIIAGARRLTGLLQEAGFLAVSIRAHTIVADATIPYKPDETPAEERQLFVEMEAAVAAAEDARQHGIGMKAGDLARRESLVLTPSVSALTVNGLRRVAATHSLIGGLRFQYQLSRSLRGPIPRTASELFARPDRQTRERAIAALQSLDS